ncbi:MAG: phosphatase PAP2 family protein [Sphingomonas sp.]|uniref:phosphatase PAP2 family protein n=1 Tax=Sphingomonas sp. TaxID=28214 RepID=UPI001B27001C|nr:phosphatase PAP2 family protein [Sphingomonas sp.]MBO9624279.1 phosphatase PAP2 family protein [Sphingomonas sp.]
MESPPDPVATLKPEAAASRRVPWPIVGLAAVALLLLGLVWFGHEIMEGDTAAIDRAIMQAMRVPGHPGQPVGPAWLPSAVRDVTALGSTTVLTMVVLVTACFLALRRRFRSALLVLAATSLGALAVTLVKALIARSRPDLVERLMQEASHSFPSGHAANSAIVYLTLATLLFPVLRGWRMRGFVLGVAILLVGLIGVSRVYLGVHWPSDVLAGWAFGSCWALLWWGIELKLFGKS